MSQTTPELLRINQVCRRTGMSRSSVYARIADGSFPQPVRLSSRMVAWPSTEVDAWITRMIERERA